MKVEPFIDLKDVKSIKKLLKDNPRDRLLFIMGINSGLRVQDLLELKVADVLGVKVGDRIAIREKKTGKDNVLIFNKEIMDAITGYLAAVSPEPYHFLFKSRKGKNYPLTTFAVTKYVKEWAAALNLKGNFGAHTLRKTWCYQQRKTFGVSWEVIAKRLNHSSPAITRRYLGIQEEEVEEILMNTI
ncbi:Tyrosine recombinase XerC [Fundidesulfovibrio magnetotacticus]|uniref:Tyrosine recombinase XerC n=1 Tax=Fundidesulfovibrio magnetotacticus TaxID=2730080 RepID=A0A6V8LR30_9BACT|nr:tyrosine-type recombinase/integrase [Fundidesulfovibrio magnetotacticus]GFK92798.1 Tyrosine recombinase XerC [Fundidesulfovibrio magnetotacticus]